MEEIWKDILFIQKGVIYNFIGKYQCSNMGEIKSLPKTWKCGKDGNVIKNTSNVIMKGAVSKCGYRAVSFRNNGKTVTLRIARIVAQLFVDNPNKYPEVNHKDGNKLNNRSDNLEWCTHTENIRHSFRMGLHKSKTGKDHHNFGKPWMGSNNKYWTGIKGKSHPSYGRVPLNCILVLNTANGIFYSSITEAAKTTGIEPSFLSKKLHGRYTNNTPFILA